jgi:hypothetical protein
MRSFIICTALNFIMMIISRGVRWVEYAVNMQGMKSIRPALLRKHKD